MITIVTAHRALLFGRCNGGSVILSGPGNVVRDILLSIPQHWPAIALDEWVLMPDHLHMILVVTHHLPVGLPQVVGNFKSASTRALRLRYAGLNGTIWQRGFHDRLLRDECALAAARRYIALNPSRP